MNLLKYKFKDELGHPLENCIDYQKMQSELLAARAVVEAARARLDQELAGDPRKYISTTEVLKRIAAYDAIVNQQPKEKDESNA